MHTYRMWVPHRKGRSDLHYNDRDINRNSIVHISVSEATERSDVGGFGPQIQDFVSHFGDASVTLQNVSVRDGGVDFYVDVASPVPLNLVTDITVVDGPPQIIIGT